MSESRPASDGASALMYRQLILDHYKNPRQWGTAEPTDLERDGDNPLCGDRLHITVRVDREQIVDARFEGHGCAISQAAADILLESLRKKRLDDVMGLDESHIRELLGIPLSPSRMKCAKLALVVLQDAIRIERGERDAAEPTRTE